MIAFFELLLGLLLLLGGGYFLVKGASGIATRFNVSPIIVGLTIMAFGTSAPELFVGVMAALQDQTDIAFGNVVGSNIANLGLVLGVAAVVKPLEIHGQIVRRELPLLLLATGAILIMAMDPLMRGEIGVIDRSDAVILVFLFLIFFYVTALDVLERRSDDSLMVDFDHSRKLTVAASSARDWLSIAIGFTGLLIGGRLTISGGVELAAILNVPSAIVGLFVVAAGTSLPELVTSIIAALRREPDLALGNVIGSNLFNGLAVLPITGLVRPVVVPDGGLFDLAVSFLFAVVLIPIFYVGRARLGRGIGCVFLIAYLAYVVARLLHG